MRMLDPETVIKLGETLGIVSPIEHSKEIVGGDFLHVRVEVDVSKPLCRGCGVILEENKEIWVSSKYEKLPNFCYWCGLVSHAKRSVIFGWVAKVHYPWKNKVMVHGYGHCLTTQGKFLTLQYQALAMVLAVQQFRNQYQNTR